MPTVPSVPGISGIPGIMPTVPSVPGVMPTVPSVPSVVSTIPSVVPTIAPTICRLDVRTVAEEVLPSLFDDVIQGGIGRFKTQRCIGADIGVSIPDTQHRSRSEPNTEDLQAIQKGAPREPFVVQLPLYFLGLLKFLPVTHSCLPSHKDVAAGIGFRKERPLRLQRIQFLRLNAKSPPVVCRDTSAKLQITLRFFVD